MKDTQGSRRWAAAMVAMLMILATPIAAPAQTFQVLYRFTGGTDGAEPAGGLIIDSQGNFYGITQLGGDLSCNNGYGCGTVFKLERTGGETVIYSFLGGSDGQEPIGGLLRDTAGNLYGTTNYGGTSPCGYFGSCGTVFKLDASGNHTVLYSFLTAADGAQPQGTLVMDPSGNLYGTTYEGGDLGCGYNGCGEVFELNTANQETVVYPFTDGADGGYPAAGVIRDSAGHLYGVNQGGGNFPGCTDLAGCGTVFRVNPNGTETTLHTFTGADGANSSASLINDSAGNLYGTAVWGGSSNACSNFNVSGCGTVIKLDRTGQLTVLYNFSGGTDGAYPRGPLVRDSAGNLYGTTLGGGAFGYGTVFELDASGTETVLHSFDAGDGSSPIGGLVRDGAGNLYGVTSNGGNHACSSGCGVVFGLKP